MGTFKRSANVMNADWRVSRKSPFASDERSFDIAKFGDIEYIEEYENFLLSNFDLKTATEFDKESVHGEDLLTADDINESPLTISPYQRSVSPDTMLRGATSSSISLRLNNQATTLASNYSSDFSFFGMNSITNTAEMGSNVLVKYWWDITPQNMHIIVTNYLHDADNKRCVQCFSYLESKLGISRVAIFYTIFTLYLLHIMSGDLAKFSYYTLGVAYPMYKSFTTFQSGGVNASTSWLRYWVVFGWLAVVDVFLYRYLNQWTVYWSLKTVFTIYLIMPLIKGADLLYRDFIKNFNKSIEATIYAIFGE